MPFPLLRVRPVSVLRGKGQQPLLSISFVGTRVRRTFDKRRSPRGPPGTAARAVAAKPAAPGAINAKTALSPGRKPLCTTAGLPNAASGGRIIFPSPLPAAVGGVHCDEDDVWLGPGLIKAYRRQAEAKPEAHLVLDGRKVPHISTTFRIWFGLRSFLQKTFAAEAVDLADPPTSSRLAARARTNNKNTENTKRSLPNRLQFLSSRCGTSVSLDVVRRRWTACRDGRCGPRTPWLIPPTGQLHPLCKATTAPCRAQSSQNGKIGRSSRLSCRPPRPVDHHRRPAQATNQIALVAVTRVAPSVHAASSASICPRTQPACPGRSLQSCGSRREAASQAYFATLGSSGPSATQCDHGVLEGKVGRLS